MQLIPPEYEFESYQNAYMNTSTNQPIKTGSHVRVRIVGTKVDPTEIVSGVGFTSVPLFGLLLLGMANTRTEVNQH